MGIWKDEHIEKLKTITSFIATEGSVVGIQLAHAGRKASFDKPWIDSKQIKEGEQSWQTVAPSAIPFHADDMMPVSLSKAGIEKVKTDFKTGLK